MRERLAGWAGLIGVLFFVAEVVIGAAQFEHYSHVRQFISETYATGTPWSDALRFGGVLPAGVLIAVFAFAAAGALSIPRSGMIGFTMFGVFYGLGTVVTALFPCDFGCDPELADPTISHVLHFAAGTLTYLFTPLTLLLIATAAKGWPNAVALRNMLLVCALVMLFGVMVLFLFPIRNILGSNQRIVEGAALLAIVSCSIYLLKRSRS